MMPPRALLSTSLPRFLVMVLLITCSAGVASVLAERNYSETRKPCTHYQPLRQAFFGDLHVHTRYSLDASTQGTLTSPAQAYEFATGATIGIQPWNADGSAQRSLQLDRPLDFAMVSDHAELFGETVICGSPGMRGYDAWQCRMYRRWPRAAYYWFNYWSAQEAERLGFCGENGDLCRQAAAGPWLEMQQAAEHYYDRSEQCSFTSFIGYEWTGGSDGDRWGNIHRNVVFRNAEVPDLPISFMDSPRAELLFAGLQAHCDAGNSGCQSLTIPHNSNLSAGLMFQTLNADGSALSVKQAALHRRYQPLVEIMQHKGSSECYFDAAVTRDELCAFEQLPNRSFTDSGPAKPGDGFLREVLRDGLLEQQRSGENPFKFGLLASSDTHLGTPGAVTEDSFLGHGGAGVPAAKEIPPGLPDFLQYNPGGLAVLWAEENSRDALFDAMLRREAYGTSGPRITTRFFAAWDFPDQLCETPDLVATAYARGVAMGSDLPDRPGPDSVPALALFAQQDAGTKKSPGMPLQRIQVVKGWIDAQGERREEVFDVAGNANNGATVNTRNCETKGNGFASLCAVWRDPSFDPAEPAYYYSRVLENPSCRWSQQICAANHVDCARPQTIGEGLDGCCAPEHRPVVQERAWTSPIWYTP